MFLSKKKKRKKTTNSLPAEFSLSQMLNEAKSIATEQFGDNVSMRSVNVVKNSDEQAGKAKKKHSLLTPRNKKKSESMEIQFTFNPALVKQVQQHHQQHNHHHRPQELRYVGI